MMSFLLLLFGALICGLLLGPCIAAQPKTLWMIIGHYHIEISLWLFMLIAVIALVMFLSSWHLLLTLWHYRNWLRKRREQRAQQQMHKALFALLSGDHQQAEQLFSCSRRVNFPPLLGALLAAEVAMQQSAWQRAKDYLAQVEVDNGHRVVVEIMRIRLQIALHELRAAQQGVEGLQRTVPQHPGVVRLVQQLQKALQGGRP